MIALHIKNIFLVSKELSNINDPVRSSYFWPTFVNK
jgi:hypothetical protein